MIAICAVLLCCVEVTPAPSQSPPPPALDRGEPITPIPAARANDPLKVQLGEKLFSDRRISHDNSRTCQYCHDVATNGASQKPHDVALDGMELPLNTPTVFNSTLNFRFTWEGKFRTVEADIKASLESPHTMGSSAAEAAEKLDADLDMRGRFLAAYGRRPEGGDVIDALASYQRTLLTPGGRFDRWLQGDDAALSADELDGYRLFKSLGCSACHQGVNVGGNLFERHGIFHPLASPEPKILRVPSLRNVATTPPYFHDGSAPTLDDAVRKMALAQLNATLTDQQVKALVAFLGSLTGTYRGATVGGAP
ncbi:cytochrome-c peroxidase [Bradyrhizobium sp. CCGB20]|uniref:cytochrome-c peroxidase n=1 Tax=Bradyrhizobium sp. CCGB20 TaxID=2949633 RepID=UPI0020B18020|nr:cytochrome c peroxidase [Bradyrhizobium sp. CCGB20]MCP3397861.1 c-type cytochrome [Bradyrhizobium sp. CCGB20]